jgi:hypothetical protein
MEVVKISDCSLETIEKISKTQKDIFLEIHPEYDNVLKEFIGFECINNLTGLKLGSYVGKNVDMKSIFHIDTLMDIWFENGLNNKSQYEFINKQKKLKKMFIKNIDLKFCTINENLEELRIKSTIKNESLLHELFPKLIKFKLHGDSRRTNHEFIQKLENIEEIELSYNSHLYTFPEMKNKEIVKSIRLLNCYNFNDINSILVFKNLEEFCLTSYDKKLQLSIDCFIKLKQLRKLKVVYSNCGKEDEKIKEIYKETGWVNKIV